MPVYATVLQNDARRGHEIWKRILPLVHLYTHQQIGPVSDLVTYRSILNCWGLQGGYSRDPFHPLDAEQQRRLGELLELSGWINPEQVNAEFGPCALRS